MNNSTVQQQCPTYEGTPDLFFPYACAVPLYQNQAKNASLAPYHILQYCCAGASVGFYGPNDCTAYCNATKDTQETLQRCLTDNHLESLCASSANAQRWVGWGSYFVVTMAVLALIQS